MYWKEWHLMKESGSMNSVQEIASHPLQHMGYFMGWGGKTWQRLMAHAFEHFLGVNLQGKQLLDIGTCYGKMACLFTLLRAKVIGLDLSRKCLSVAQKEATKWNITDRVVFVLSRGDLSIFKDNSFDVVFSKSVLVVVPDLAGFLEEIKAKLKPGGKIVFLENAKGSWWVHLLRAFRHGKWDYTKARYFTPHETRLVSDVFDEVVVKSRAFPPVVLIMGCKRG